MAIKRRATTVLALSITTALLAAGCTGGGESEAPPESDLYKNPVTLTWWHNASQDGPGKTYWEKVAKDFNALHPTVTIEIEGIETNQLQRTRLPAALLSNDPPDIFQAWGGGEIREQVEADYLKDITEQVKDEAANIGSAVEIWQVDGKQYGLPYRMGIEGIWYNKELFQQAGIAAPPTTFDELNDAVTKLKAINVVPIAVGAGDKWPAAHWWYNFALRACSVDTLRKASLETVFDDQCFVKAGQDLKAFIDTKPFQNNFIATPGQNDPTSANGLLANGKAAMELMGDWNRGSLDTVTEDQEALGRFIGWFPVPAIAGSAGDPKAALGGGDGFACAKNAPAECVEFLKYIVSPEVQLGYAETGTGLPVAKGAEEGVKDPALKSILEATTSATYVQLWLDTAFGSTVGNAMNDAIVAIFAGSGTPEQVVEAMKAAARK
ncbi:raffinose/stachyose/melibiose transport system substrate-binding protein [Micromonospora phaseoli]|uniref:Raffinose/stachyose/melibiose transport system substrate-binding protein n=1 Tax=Micromonospora phaseoli TaxID=1144548 RepID=A0A1H6YV06_9ACTN|nr:extracellular solute-binding protein [Micromonospora phaseoli]PZW00437.1 carbohydrate ABC transporter substrate-binding protein (CUT1 family) [Micromonospora phaseoli]GIJ76916.1 sugar ABC transporter substrate-binding protein [Micromonospora phaseoli]SEJ45059.1 raffinose/stachyose/melibiose transport system substrate-binding protein [Micromonospora phaseoli]